MSRETTLTIGTRVHRLAMTSQRGPRGPVGPQGDAGPTGATGAPGAVQSVASVAPDGAGNVPITRADIGAAAESHTHPATQISDSTAVGRAVLTAADAATARTAIDAPSTAQLAGVQATAEAALPKAGGTMTGPVVLDDSAQSVNNVPADVQIINGALGQAGVRRLMRDDGTTIYYDRQDGQYSYRIWDSGGNHIEQINNGTWRVAGTGIVLIQGPTFELAPPQDAVALAISNSTGFASASTPLTAAIIVRACAWAWNGSAGYVIGSAYTQSIRQRSAAAGDAECEVRNSADTAIARIDLPTGQHTFAAIAALTDLSGSCGDASRRWTQVHAQDGTIQTSDARLKSAVEPLSPALTAIGLQCARETGRYKWLARIAEVGDAARWHIGLTAQRVVEIFDQHGEDAYAYGIVCHDTWPERVEIVTPAEYEQRDTGTLDEQGMPVYETVETTPAVTRTIPAGDAYSLRYDELSRLIAAAMIADRDALEVRVTALEGGA